MFKEVECHSPFIMALKSDDSVYIQVRFWRQMYTIYISKFNEETKNYKDVEKRIELFSKEEMEKTVEILKQKYGGV